MTALKQEIQSIDAEAESPRVPAPIDALIERAVMTPDFNVEKLERLFEFKQRIEATEGRKAFDEGLGRRGQQPVSGLAGVGVELHQDLRGEPPVAARHPASRERPLGGVVVGQRSCVDQDVGVEEVGGPHGL